MQHRPWNVPVRNLCTNPGPGVTIAGWMRNSAAQHAVTVVDGTFQMTVIADTIYTMISVYSMGLLDNLRPVLPAGSVWQSQVQVWVPVEGVVIAQGALGTIVPAATWTTLRWETIGTGADPGQRALAVQIRPSDLTRPPIGTVSYLRHAMLVESRTPVAYADGDSPGWQWDGPAHASTSTGYPTP